MSRRSDKNLTILPGAEASLSEPNPTSESKGRVQLAQPASDPVQEKHEKKVLQPKKPQIRLQWFYIIAVFICTGTQNREIQIQQNDNLSLPACYLVLPIGWILFNTKNELLLITLTLTLTLTYPALSLNLDTMVWPLKSIQWCGIVTYQLTIGIPRRHHNPIYMIILL